MIRDAPQRPFTQSDSSIENSQRTCQKNSFQIQIAIVQADAYPTDITQALDFFKTLLQFKHYTNN